MTRSSSASVSIQDVTKTFDGGVCALDNVTLEVAPGSFTSLIGASGCGKSTLLRIVAGLISPSSGSVSVGGGDTPGTLGFVFQEPTLMPWSTVEKNVGLPLELLDFEQVEKAKRIAWALDLVGLSEFREAYPRELSGGMKMRVSIARALVSRPKLLLLDEPFAALDEFTRARLNQDLLDIWRDQDLTVLFVTHSVFESVFLSTDVLVMSPRPGRIAATYDVYRPDAPTEEWRLTQQYTEQCGKISQTLRTTMEGRHD